MTQDEIMMCADASGISLYGLGKDRAKFIHYLEAFANLIAKYEREACAKVAEEKAICYAERGALPEKIRDIDPKIAVIASQTCGHVAQAIRERGQA